MHIIIITPAKRKSLSGNRATAQRWAIFLRRLGHKVDIAVTWDESSCNLMIALHAWRSANSIANFKKIYPDKPLIVCMTGTDLYRFIHSHPKPTHASIKSANRLVVLHSRAHLALPKEAWPKVHVIYQSAEPLPFAINRSKRSFDICVVGHLRDEKDCLRTAYAVHDLPSSSHIRVLHYGKAHNADWAEKAQTEAQHNPRYYWLGEIKHWQIRQAYSRCHLMVLSSKMEGGANVISEATVAGLPVIASHIDGSIGLLGKDFLGYYPVQDTEALRRLLIKAENDSIYLNRLKQQGDHQARLFLPETECHSWKSLLEDMGL